jgi:hypothetical protein
MTDSVIDFPDQKPWMRPQPDFEDDARDFARESPYGRELAEDLRSCNGPFIRAAIILRACSAEDVPFLLLIAEHLKGEK